MPSLRRDFPTPCLSYEVQTILQKVVEMSEPKRPATQICAPYRLENTLQHYNWGTRNADAFIPHLMGIPVEPERPYAELWIGTHPSAPSQVILGTERTSLIELIARYPADILGTQVAQCFGNNLPFLLKVLSAAEPLSIQAHPDKTQARRLHARDPQHYPDANHKPEVAIALDSLTALVGLKGVDALNATWSAYPEIAGFIGEVGPTPRDSFVMLIRRSLSAPEVQIATSQQLASRLMRTSRPLTEIESLFLALRQAYGDGDIGLLALFLLNLVHLKAGEGLYLPAGVPHAYLRGNLVECMANSDNVIRVGLTPKFKDAETLLEVLAPEVGLPEILRAEPEPPAVRYPTPAEEFELRRLDLDAGAQHPMPHPASVEVYLVLEGYVRVTWNGGEEDYKRGESFLIPVCLPAWHLTALEKATLFKASMPG